MTDLPPTAERLYRVIYDAAKTGKKTHTIEQFTHRLHMDRTTVVRSLRTLRDAGMIEVDAPIPTAKSRRYFVKELGKWTDFCDDQKTVLRDCITGCGKKIHSEGPHHRMCAVCRSEKSQHQEYGNGSGWVIPARGV